MTQLTASFLILFSLFCQGQALERLILKGNYTSSDSTQITEAYLLANQAVIRMHRSMDSIWRVTSKQGLNKNEIRMRNWENDQTFMTWLGKPDKIRMAHRIINRIHSKFMKKITLEISKENKGKCTGWIGAWTIPFGKVKIRLCEDYFINRTYLQEKILIHEIGHDAGLLLHRKIHWCWAAKRAAYFENDIAKRSPENYAWLAVSYIGIGCSY